MGSRTLMTAVHYNVVGPRKQWKYVVVLVQFIFKNVSASTFLFSKVIWKNYTIILTLLRIITSDKIALFQHKNYEDQIPRRVVTNSLLSEPGNINFYEFCKVIFRHWLSIVKIFNNSWNQGRRKQSNTGGQYGTRWLTISQIGAQLLSWDSVHKTKPKGTRRSMKRQTSVGVEPGKVRERWLRTPYKTSSV